MDTSSYNSARSSMLGTLSGPAIAIAGYGATRCAGAYLSLCSIATLSAVDLGRLSLMHSALWWISLVTAGGLRMAYIAKSSADRDLQYRYDSYAESIWMILSVVALLIGIFCFFFLKEPLLICSTMWCYTGALWSDWYAAKSARDNDFYTQGLLLILGALVQGLSASIFVQMAGIAGALSAQGIFYWTIAVGGWIIYPRVERIIPPPSQLYEGIPYLPGLLYGWISCCATRWLLFTFYGTAAVGEWAPIELIVSPLVTTCATLFSTIYLPRILSGSLQSVESQRHIFWGLILGCSLAVVLYIFNWSLIVALSIIYATLLIAIMIITAPMQRVTAKIYERLIALGIAVLQGVVGAITWPIAGIVGVLIGQIWFCASVMVILWIMKK